MNLLLISRQSGEHLLHKACGGRQQFEQPPAQHRSVGSVKEVHLLSTLQPIEEAQQAPQDAIVIGAREERRNGQPVLRGVGAARGIRYIKEQVVEGSLCAVGALRDVAEFPAGSAPCRVPDDNGKNLRVEVVRGVEEVVQLVPQENEEALGPASTLTRRQESVDNGLKEGLFGPERGERGGEERDQLGHVGSEIVEGGAHNSRAKDLRQGGGRLILPLCHSEQVGSEELKSCGTGLGAESGVRGEEVEVGECLPSDWGGREDTEEGRKGPTEARVGRRDGENVSQAVGEGAGVDCNVGGVATKLDEFAERGEGGFTAAEEFPLGG